MNTNLAGHNRQTVGFRTLRKGRSFRQQRGVVISTLAQTML